MSAIGRFVDDAITLREERSIKQGARLSVTPQCSQYCLACRIISLGGDYDHEY